MASKSITKANPRTIKNGPLAGQTFHTERSYRDALAQLKGFQSYEAQRSVPRVIGSADKLTGLSTAENEKRGLAFKVIAIARRENISPSAAAKKAGTTLGTVKKYAGIALDKRGNRYSVKDYDRLSRHTTVPTKDGTLSVIVNDSRTATLLGDYWRAVDYYMETGDNSKLQKFRGKGVTIDKKNYPFITDTTVIDCLHNAGLLTVEIGSGQVIR